MNMREKIARAIVASDFNGDDTVFDTMTPEMQENFYRNADAVLDALMEPTEGMVEAGTFRDDGADRTNAEGVFRAMIQAAKEGIARQTSGELASPLKLNPN